MKGEEVARRVRPDVVRRRLLALLDRNRMSPSPEIVGRSGEWQAGYAEGLRTAWHVIRKG